MTFDASFVGTDDIEIELTVKGSLAFGHGERRLGQDLSCELRNGRTETFVRTTLFTRPHRSAVSASTRSPVSSISMACLREMLRATATPGVLQKNPQVTPAW